MACITCTNMFNRAASRIVISGAATYCWTQNSGRR
ncbi:unnamed protein product [Linum tenue]|uniref:Uncharacterized protein n=1 Tax=Linum tenue TaxID=586396 RepID=A0AAV0L5H3_9ROSI|nr:unnamed protein product [Linum tenue]